ncbi:hypothetical protein BGP77_02065 [Saccharospirillum sp. MSK14-1]|uniref:DUF3581 domain-containing protein n=1 Tax=Saccharospirillum sp. MSK14-1 TaxID=1897632 RepID=UPI000D350A0B|nr:DUF3581 domain-containing protein [Saccharospirillum sp. MSK14-1]PTY36125.1 hypothetical protein BGP77_02065 [Saccharospirillum sp. MSK14-1]
MFLDPFHRKENGYVLISADQASNFAKDVAGDFNPIHNPDAKRFCVPGDLLFALVLERYGVSERMSVRFSGMVGDNVPLVFPEVDEGVIDVQDTDGKAYLHLEHGGKTSHDAALIEQLTRRYVAFSGHNFPFIMVPLMEQHGVMFNPKRPLVIYESMAFELNHLNIEDPGLELASTSLEVNGKRADVHFEFNITAAGDVVGTGSKKLIVSGLQPYDSAAMDDMVEQFEALKRERNGG